MQTTSGRRLFTVLAAFGLAACAGDDALDLDAGHATDSDAAPYTVDGATVAPIAITPAGPTTLVVHVDGLRNDTGHLRCTLFANANGWPSHSDQGYALVSGDIAQDAGDCVFENVPAGTYSVVFAHDENDNNTFDQGVFGIPLEGYGFSNNVHPGLGAPPFDRCSFSVDGVPMSVTIHALY